MKSVLKDIVYNHSCDSLIKLGSNITPDIFIESVDNRANNAKVPSRLRTYNIHVRYVHKKYHKYNIGDDIISNDSILVLPSNIMFQILLDNTNYSFDTELEELYYSDKMKSMMSLIEMSLDDFKSIYGQMVKEYTIMGKLEYNNAYIQKYIEVSILLGINSPKFSKSNDSIMKQLELLYMSGPYDIEDDLDKVSEKQKGATTMNM